MPLFVIVLLLVLVIEVPLKPSTSRSTSPITS
jgi:hypothetical protein